MQIFEFTWYCVSRIFFREEITWTWNALIKTHLKCKALYAEFVIMFAFEIFGNNLDGYGILQGMVC